MANEPFGSATLRRIEWLTLVLGGLGAAAAAWRWGWRGSVGLAIGAVLMLLSFAVVFGLGICSFPSWRDTARSVRRSMRSGVGGSRRSSRQRT